MKKTYIIPTTESISLSVEHLLCESMTRGRSDQQITNQSDILTKENKNTGYKNLWDEQW